MTNTLIPRGPDAEGLWLSEHAGLGHRRLAVIDLDRGTQPMTVSISPGAPPYVLTFSGEIYNFRQLRTELSQRGHHFTTRSDTEVLLHSYLEWGAECVRRLRGMFAFAVWDPTRHGLLLARDRLGVKPLHYLPYATGMVFGSELKTVLAHPMATAEVSNEGLAELVCSTFTPGHAVFRDIRSLRPGHWVWCDRDGYHEHRYWQLESAEHRDDFPTTVGTVRELLKDVVQQQLVADVPVGALLSGGLDSSAITALAAKNMRGLATYSLDFDDSKDNFHASLFRPEQDAPFARQVADHVGTRHTELVPHVDEVIAAWKNVLRARDIPGLADLNAAQYLLFRAVRHDSTVVLSGESADEIFGGYPWFHHPGLLAKPGFPWAVTAAALAPVLNPEVLHWIQPREYLADRYAQALAEVPVLKGENSGAARIRALFYLNITRWLTMLLDSKDRMSMRVGLEVRVPLCDHRLVEYVWNVPWSYKTMGGHVKSLLRHAVSDLLPRTVLERRKTAFPVSQHPGYAHALREMMRSELANPDWPLRALVRPDAVADLIAAPVTGPSLWSNTDTVSYLLQLGEWLREYRVRIR